MIYIEVLFPYCFVVDKKKTDGEARCFMTLYNMSYTPTISLLLFDLANQVLYCRPEQFLTRRRKSLRLIYYVVFPYGIRPYYRPL